ncbi:MAG: helix-turn-helix domain-containing protein [Bacteroidaceae bacterium]|nr:helix-turn-helix domain-containing protein [Bacteroidaceae bacterium]
MKVNKSNGYGNNSVEENDERFLTREETAKLLHVDFSTLWRWNKQGVLCPNKVGPRRIMYKYVDVLKKLNGKG